MKRLLTTAPLVLSLVFPVAAIAQSAPATKPVIRWKLTASKSPLDDSETITLTLTANAPVRAWLKVVTPQLVLRCKEKILDTYIVTGTAATVESGGDGHTVRLRFDTDSAETQGWGQSTDREALFAPEPEQFLDRLRTARRLLFEFIPFNASPVIASFSTAGLEPLARRLVSACPEATKTIAQRRAERSQQQANTPAREDPQEKTVRGLMATADIGVLVGINEATIRKLFGEPLQIDGAKWTYATESGQVSIYVSSGRVTLVDPSTTKLRAVKSSAPKE